MMRPGDLERLVGALSTGAATCQRTAEQSFEAAESFSDLNAVRLLDPAVVMAAAARADERRRKTARPHRLLGVPFANKDMFRSPHHPTTAGTGFDLGSMLSPGMSRTERLLEAGGIEIGVAHQSPFGLGTAGSNEILGPCRNPIDGRLIPGGSSSGSAALVSAGVVPFSYGTDTGGSMRIPASLCDVVGFKPTNRRWPNSGMMPLVRSLDVWGLIAKTVRDVAFLFGAEHKWEMNSAPARTIGWLDPPDAADAVREAAQAAQKQAEKAGYDVVAAPMWDEKELEWLSGRVIAFELHDLYANLLRREPHLFAADVAEAIVEGQLVSRPEYDAAKLQLHQRCGDYLDQLGRNCDIAALPTLPVLPVSVSDAGAAGSNRRRELYARLSQYTRVANVMSMPAISIPMPPHVRGNNGPVGLQLLGRPHHDASPIETAKRLELTWDPT